MADRNTAIRRSQLKPIREDDLDAINTPSDKDTPKYDSATQKFKWGPSSGNPNYTDVFEYNVGGDIEVKGIVSIFEFDANNDLMPTLSGTVDDIFEVIGGEIAPKV